MQLNQGGSVFRAAYDLSKQEQTPVKQLLSVHFTQAVYYKKKRQDEV